MEDFLALLLNWSGMLSMLNQPSSSKVIMLIRLNKWSYLLAMSFIKPLGQTIFMLHHQNKWDFQSTFKPTNKPA